MLAKDVLDILYTFCRYFVIRGILSAKGNILSKYDMKTVVKPRMKLKILPEEREGHNIVPSGSVRDALPSGVMVPEHAGTPFRYWLKKTY